jgi:hypothetical protein
LIAAAYTSEPVELIAALRTVSAHAERLADALERDNG